MGVIQENRGQVVEEVIVAVWNLLMEETVAKVEVMVGDQPIAFPYRY